MTRLGSRISTIATKHDQISEEFKGVKISVDKIQNKSTRLENLDVEKKQIGGGKK